jgi:hypothetical protein
MYASRQRSLQISQSLQFFKFLTVIAIVVFATTGCVAQTSPTVWSPLGNRGFTTGNVRISDVARNPLDENIIYAAVVEFSGGSVFGSVRKFNRTTSTWSVVGSPNSYSVGTGCITRVAVSSLTGAAYVSFSDVANSNYVLKNSGGLWSTVGNPTFSPLDMKIANDDTLYAAYISNGETVIAANSGGSWSVIGGAQYALPQAFANRVFLTIHRDGTPYVGLADATANNAVRVFRIYNGVWQNISSPLFSSLSASFVSVAVCHDNVTYVAFSNSANGNVARVFRTTVSGWEEVGSMSGTRYFTQISCTTNSNVWVVATDSASGNQVNVLASYLLGSTWTDVVQQPGAAEALSVRAALSHAEMPVISFADASMAGSVSVVALGCSSGQYYASKMCYDCPSGSAAPAGSSSCTACTAGTFASSNAAVCSQCTAGSYSGANATVCSVCAAGTYAEQQGSSMCQRCPMGSASIVVGSSRASDCSFCAAGTFSAMSGAPDCDACVPGTYNSNIGSSSCSLCPAGTYNPLSKQTSQSACIRVPKGYMAPSSGASAATECPVGTYSDALGGISCLTCPSGYRSRSTGLKSSADCNALDPTKVMVYSALIGICSSGVLFFGAILFQRYILSIKLLLLRRRLARTRAMVGQYFNLKQSPENATVDQESGCKIAPSQLENGAEKESQLPTVHMSDQSGTRDNDSAEYPSAENDGFEQLIASIENEVTMLEKRMQLEAVRRRKHPIVSALVTAGTVVGLCASFTAMVFLAIELHGLEDAAVPQ